MPAPNRSYELELLGGHPNSLGRTPEVVAAVLADQTLLERLFATLASDDAVVRMRAGDALEKVCRQQPAWFEQRIERVFGEMAAIDQLSIQWHVVQILGEIRLTAAQRRRAVALAQRLLTTASDWIVLNTTMQQLFAWSRDDPALAAWLAPQLTRLAGDPRRSVARRATRLLTSG